MKLRSLGYHGLSDDEIWRCIEAGNFRALIAAPGDFVLIAERGAESWIVSSVNCIRPYFYRLEDTRFFHSETVFDLLKQASLKWRWNWNALADLWEIEHLVDNDSLHAAIHRVPPRTLIHFRDGKLDRQEREPGRCINDGHHDLGDGPGDQRQDRSGTGRSERG